MSDYLPAPEKFPSVSPTAQLNPSVTLPGIQLLIINKLPAGKKLDLKNINQSEPAIIVNFKRKPVVNMLSEKIKVRGWF